MPLLTELWANSATAVYKDVAPTALAVASIGFCCFRPTTTTTTVLSSN